MTTLTARDLERIAAQPGYAIVSDTGNGTIDMSKTPDHKRMEERQAQQSGPMLIVLPNERPVSLNQWYSGQHWTKRKREATRVHSLVRAQLDGYRTFTRPVCITVTAYFKSRPQDASNIVAKIYEDALIGYVLIDDGPKHVRSMTTESRIDKSNPRVEIRIEEAQQ